MKSLENIASEAMLLPKDQRFALAHRILSSVEPEIETEVETRVGHGNSRTNQKI